MADKPDQNGPYVNDRGEYTFADHWDNAKGLHDLLRSAHPQQAEFGKPSVSGMGSLWSDTHLAMGTYLYDTLSSLKALVGAKWTGQAAEAFGEEANKWLEYGKKLNDVAWGPSANGKQACWCFRCTCESFDAVMTWVQDSLNSSPYTHNGVPWKPQDITDTVLSAVGDPPSAEQPKYENLWLEAYDETPSGATRADVIAAYYNKVQLTHFQYLAKYLQVMFPALSGKIPVAPAPPDDTPPPGGSPGSVGSGGLDPLGLSGPDAPSFDGPESPDFDPTISSPSVADPAFPGATPGSDFSTPPFTGPDSPFPGLRDFDPGLTPTSLAGLPGSGGPGLGSSGLSPLNTPGAMSGTGLGGPGSTGNFSPASAGNLAAAQAARGATQAGMAGMPMMYPPFMPGAGTQNQGNEAQSAKFLVEDQDFWTVDQTGCAPPVIGGG